MLEADRERRQVQARLALAAYDLARERGYDAVTVDDIAWAAGVSRRAFFRCYASKRDAMLFWSDDVDAFVLRHARVWLSREGSAWETLALLCAMAMRDCLGAPEQVRTLHRLIEESDDLRSGSLERREVLCRNLVELTDLGDSRRDVELTVRCAMAILSTVVRWWVATDGAHANDALRLMRADFDRLAHVFPALLAGQ